MAPLLQGPTWYGGKTICKLSSANIKSWKFLLVGVKPAFTILASSYNNSCLLFNKASASLLNSFKNLSLWVIKSSKNNSLLFIKS